jgi:hypothetical protein
VSEKVVLDHRVGLSCVIAACQVLLLSAGAEGRQPARTTSPFALTKGSEVAAAINLPEKNLKLAGALFIPASAPRIRAVLVVMEHGPTEELLLTAQNPYSVWHAAAESLSCGLLHLRVTSIHAPEPGPRPPETEPDRNAAAGGGDGLLALMRQFGRESGHAELADVPFLFLGMVICRRIRSIIRPPAPRADRRIHSVSLAPSRSAGRPADG